ncbi:MAG: carbohydrate ABC transporter permease, partial [Elusimicrobiota bacterium]
MAELTEAPTPEAKPRARFSARSFLSPFVLDVLTHFALLSACALCAYPLLRMLSVSLRPGDRLISTDLAIIPAGASLASYRDVLYGTGFLAWLWNSLVITVTTSFVGVSLASTAAYAFSRFKFPGSRLGLTLLLGTQMIPAAMLLLPLFLMIMRLGLVNTYLGMVLASSVSSMPFRIWLRKGYYDTVPRSLDEAA